MIVLENKTKYTPEDMFCVTERIGNKKRNYLLCNKLQGKYIPVNPEVAFDLFGELAETVPEDVSGEIIVVGFAETATGIGAVVASYLSRRCEHVMFLPTTREHRNTQPICEFKEEHSHAVEQVLYGDADTFQRADWVVFVEDELTTGKTILNCIKELRNKFSHLKYAAVSILNCMSDEQLNTYDREGIICRYLVRAEKPELPETTQSGTDITHSIADPRLGVDIYAYELQLFTLAGKLYNKISKGMQILCLGTEECIYPAMYVGRLLKDLGHNVSVTTTTRVPTYPNEDLKSALEVPSSYGDRTTYLYGMHHYDIAFIITDGTVPPGTEKLRHVLVSNYGIPTVSVVRLVTEDYNEKCLQQ